MTRVRRERADVLGLAPRGLSAGGGKLGRERGLGRPVGLSGNRGKGERAGFGLGFSCFGFGLGPLFLLYSISKKTNMFEFKYKFEFKPHSLN